MIAQPKGLWKAPLSHEQIEAAIAFGIEHYPDAKSLDDDPYDIWVPEVKVLLTIGTAFSRIASYIGLLQRTGESLDSNIIEMQNVDETLVSGYFLVRIISPHKTVSLVRNTFKADGRPHQEGMHALERLQNVTPGKFSIGCAFKNPIPAWEFVKFELAVAGKSWIFSKYTMAHTGFSFEDLH